MIPAVYRDPKVLLLLPLGFASGLPLALSSGTLQAWLTVDGVDLKTIGWFALVGLPYTFKFLWAPLLDRYGIGPLGRRRGWMLLSQLALAAVLAAMAMSSPKASVLGLGMLAVALAFLSATQDIAIDAYRADLLRPEQRGAGAALSVFGYRMAMLVSGGLALWLADQYLGFQGVYGVMAALMVVSAVVTVLAPNAPHEAAAPRSLAEAVIAPLREFFGRRGAIVLLVLIVLYKLGDAFAGTLTTAFLIRGVGFSPAEVGAVNKGLGLVATIVGGLAGGAVLARIGLYKALLVFGVLQAVSNLGFAVLASTGKSLPLMAAVIGLENLCGGMGTAAFVALLIGLVDQRFSATQFALLSALGAVGRVYVGPSAGYLVEAVGWPVFFGLSTLVALPGLGVLWWARAQVHAADAPAQA